MAAKAVANYSAMNVADVAMQLTHNMMRGYMQVGELRAMEATVQDTVQDDVHRNTLMPDTCTKAEELAPRVSALIKQVNECELSLRSEPISSVDGLARQLLVAQFDTFKQEVDNLKQCINYTIIDVIQQANTEFQKLSPVFEKAVVQYLQTRNFKDSKSAKRMLQHLDTFNHTVTQLTGAREAWAGKKVDDTCEEDPIRKRLGALDRLIGDVYYGDDSIESALLKLDKMMAEGNASALNDRWGFYREKINKIINSLHEEVGSDQVNQWVWKLSGEKPGENYGLVHRYDDLGILKEAILLTMKSLADKIMKEEVVELDQDAVLDQLYRIIGEPKVENPKAWMKENVYYYTEELRNAIDELLVLKDQEDELRNQPLHVLAAATPILSLTSTPIELEKHEYTQIFEALAELGQKTIPSDLRPRIDAMIDQLSANGLTETINDEICRLSGREPSNNWGFAHCYDRTDVLKQALMVAVRWHVHKQFVFEIFPEIVDQNMFYAQIAKIAFEGGEIPSNVDPVAYGKENIVFHLHQRERAKEAVMEELRRG